MKKMLAALAFGIAALPVLSVSAFAHGCHRDPAADRFGWHRHVGPYCERLDLPPPREERREFRHREEYREGGRREHDRDDRPPPVCVKKCHYAGPFKECEQICR